jgi:hypothetical protein
VVAELAEELWDRFGFDVITDYSGIFDALSHKNYNVRAASAEALAAALDENQDKMQVSCPQCKNFCSVFAPLRLLYRCSRILQDEHARHI